MFKSSSLFLFAQTLAGKFSNIEQANKNPRDFAHINIYFRPIEWSILNGPWFYSEQSYDYSPWSPYRQGIHKISEYKDNFIVENYSLKLPERFAGSGFMPELLEKITTSSFIKRTGCSMHFKKINSGQYVGAVEPGKQCMIKKGETITYLVSNIQLNNSNWISLDQGFDTVTNQKVWGSENGPFMFKKVEDLGKDLVEEWLGIG